MIYGPFVLDIDFVLTQPSWELLCLDKYEKSKKKIGKKSSTFSRGIFCWQLHLSFLRAYTLAHLRVLCKSTKGTHSRCCRWYYKRKKIHHNHNWVSKLLTFEWQSMSSLALTSLEFRVEVCFHTGKNVSISYY
jgi:hypothetical protein